jgi:hypothetical protein
MQRLFINLNKKPVLKIANFYAGIETNFPHTFQVFNFRILGGTRLDVTGRLKGIIEIPYYLNREGGIFFRAGFSLKFN